MRGTSSAQFLQNVDKMPRHVMYALHEAFVWTASLEISLGMFHCQQIWWVVGVVTGHWSVVPSCRPDDCRVVPVAYGFRQLFYGNVPAGDEASMRRGSQKSNIQYPTSDIQHPTSGCKQLGSMQL